MMVQVLHVAEPSLELSTVFQLHRILITRTLCFYSVLFRLILYNAYHIASYIEVDPVFFFSRVLDSNL